jgi:predicted nucleotide-binding protein
MPEHGPTTVSKPRIFIGSSTPNLNVARAIADCLAGRNFKPQVWDEGLFKQNESTFDGLLRTSTEVEFGVFVWGASNVCMTSGQSIPAPRDKCWY